MVVFQQKAVNVTGRLQTEYPQMNVNKKQLRNNIVNYRRRPRRKHGSKNFKTKFNLSTHNSAQPEERKTK